MTHDLRLSSILFCLTGIFSINSKKKIWKKGGKRYSNIFQMMIKFNFKTSGFNSIDFFLSYFIFLSSHRFFRKKICKFDDNINWLYILYTFLEKNIFI